MAPNHCITWQFYNFVAMFSIL